MPHDLADFLRFLMLAGPLVLAALKRFGSGRRRSMAHSCPECGDVCYCNGDMDDCILDGTPEQDECEHCTEEQELDAYDQFSYEQGVCDRG